MELRDKLDYVLVAIGLAAAVVGTIILWWQSPAVSLPSVTLFSLGGLIVILSVNQIEIKAEVRKAEKKMIDEIRECSNLADNS